MLNYRKTLVLLACGSSLGALLAAQPAFAQAQMETEAAGATAPAADAQEAAETPQSSRALEEEIVVTGSRTITNGANAPTPLTVMSSTELQTTNPGNIVEGVTTLPVFSSSTKAGTTGAASTTLGGGADLLSLRGLGPSRTLLLIDGRRVVPSTPGGASDANLVPQGLISRVDIVTGGASAAYGSDAVAGVVNFVLDSKYKGLKGAVQGGISSRGDAGSYKATLTAGTAFAEDRGHLVLSGSYFKQRGIQLDYHGRDWAEAGWGLIGVSATSSGLVLAPDVRDSNATPGGLITGCQPTGAACPFRNMQFLPDGSLAPFGTGQYVSSATMSGGDGAARRTNISPEYSVKGIFGRFSFDVDPDTTVYLEGSYNVDHARYFGSQTTQSGSSAFTIFADNAFLPDAVRTAMAASGINSFTMGRANMDFGGRYGGIEFDNTAKAARFVGGIDGSLGGDWKYSAYAQYGETRFNVIGVNNQLVENLYNAADSVIDPATSKPVCRTALLGLPQGAGCVPINLFGQGAPSAQALDYVLEDSYLHSKLSQLVVSANVRGPLFSLWAEPASVAAGVEYRRETALQDSGPQSYTRTGTGIRGYPAAQVNQPSPYSSSGTTGSLDGSFNVKEGFVELNLPVVEDKPGLSRLDFNGAVRYADYSSVGSTVTWKGGVNWAPVEGLRFRATRSRDIRAPSIQERFAPPSVLVNMAVNDPQRGGARFAVNQVSQGNLGLKEETANTLVFGAVLAPHFLPGFTASVDRFNIKIDNVIAPPTMQSVVNACGASCSAVIRNPDGTINSVVIQQQNLARLHSTGEDFEIGYSTRLSGIGLDGTLRTRLLATHTEKLEVTIGSQVINRVGDLNVTPSSSPPGAVEWSGSFSLDYASDVFHAALNERYVGSGFLDKTQTYAPGQDTRVDSVFYTDISLGYKPPVLNRALEVFVTVNNLFDQAPRITPNGSAASPRAANGAFYDLIGRYFTGGIRFNF